MARPLAARTVLALYGPTSSGKTSLSVDLALRIQDEHQQPVVILSADSRQVYKYMDIGTSKTTHEEMRGIPHELLDIREPIRKLELEDYVSLARERMAFHLEAGAIPFIVGGTGIYVKALIEDWSVEAPEGIRDSLRRDFPPAMREDAYETLRRLDRAAAARVHPNNYVGIINALSNAMSSSANEKAVPSATIRPVLLGLDPDQRILDKRVAATYDSQVDRGLYREVVDLSERYDLDRKIRRPFRDDPNQVLHTHGYREYFEQAAARSVSVTALTPDDLSIVREQVLDHIRGYTRRQKSWFRKLSHVHVVTSVEQAQRVVNTAGRRR